MDWKMLAGLLLQVAFPLGLAEISKRIEKGDVPDEALTALDAVLALLAGAQGAQTDPALAELRAIVDQLRDEDREPTPEEQAKLDAYLEAQRRKAFGPA